MFKANVFITVLLLTFVVTPARMVLAQTPAPSPSPAYNYATDVDLQMCLDSEPGSSNISDVSALGLDNIMDCTFKAKDYAGTIWLGQQVLAKMSTEDPGLVQTFNEDDLNTGYFDYKIAMSYQAVGNIAATKQYLFKSYQRIKNADPNSFDNPYAPDILRALRTLEPQLAAHLDDNARKAARKAQSAYDAQLAAMSPDERTVWEQETGEPCHKEVYDAPNYHQVTWWYCDGEGHYRIAYTFLNGHLKSKYVP